MTPVSSRSDWALTHFFGPARTAVFCHRSVAGFQEHLCLPSKNGRPFERALLNSGLCRIRTSPGRRSNLPVACNHPHPTSLAKPVASKLARLRPFRRNGQGPWAAWVGRTKEKAVLDHDRLGATHCLVRDDRMAHRAEQTHGIGIEVWLYPQGFAGILEETRLRTGRKRLNPYVPRIPSWTDRPEIAGGLAPVGEEGVRW